MNKNVVIATAGFESIKGEAAKLPRTNWATTTKAA